MDALEKEMATHSSVLDWRIPGTEAEMGLLWMWVGLSCFLSSADGYVGELLESL